VNLRAGLDGYGKISSPPGFDPRTVQPVPTELSRYTYNILKYPKSMNWDSSVHVATRLRTAVSWLDSREGRGFTLSKESGESWGPFVLLCNRQRN